MPVRRHDDETVAADAARLTLALDHPVCDCVYLALAHRIGATVVTADRRSRQPLHDPAMASPYRRLPTTRKRYDIFPALRASR
ncbi:MAG: type II toxin-antitoxin system VapC family toxin [Boseongicola sp.]|nr:type II toxin-antitoxin system VapC family toxin [Boseongicola sp.]